MASSSYAARVTARIPGLLAAHPGWTEADARRYARGHGAPGEGITPEHGGAVSKVKAQIAAGGTTRRGDIQIEATYRDSRVIADVNRAADAGRRVGINVHTKQGGWQQIGQATQGRPGYSASYVAQKIADHNGDVRGAIAELLEAGGDKYDLHGAGSAAEYTADADGWQVVSYRE